jgi:hypothetical protein
VPLAQDADAAKAAYLAYWQMFDRVTNPPSPSDPAIAQFAVDPARADLVDGLNTLQAAGQTISEPAGNPSRHDVDVTITSSGATVSDCFVDTRVISDRSGGVINDAVVTKTLRGRLVVDDGQWKVTQYDELKRTDGASACT